MADVFGVRQISRLHTHTQRSVMTHTNQSRAARPQIPTSHGTHMRSRQTHEFVTHSLSLVLTQHQDTPRTSKKKSKA